MSSRVADLKWSVETLNDAIAYCKAEGEDYTKQAEMLAKYEAELAELLAKGIDRPGMFGAEVAAGTGTPVRLTDRPAAGSAAANQYGTFAVHYASPAQTRFIKSLMDRKDLTPLADSVTIDVARLAQQVATTTVNKKAASAIIDRLLALVDKPQAAAATTQAAKAVRANKYPAACIRCGATVAAEAGALAKTPEGKWAADHIGDCPATATPAPAFDGEIPAGVYVNTDGSTYRVYLGQQSGKMLAARVVDGEFEYAGMATRFVRPDARKMTAEEAGAWGKTTGRCVFCARRLDVPTSVDRGIGPDCSAKYC